MLPFYGSSSTLVSCVSVNVSLSGAKVTTGSRRSDKIGEAMPFGKESPHLLSSGRIHRQNLVLSKPYTCSVPETKTTAATERRIKKNVGFTRGRKTYETQTPSVLKSASIQNVYISFYRRLSIEPYVRTDISPNRPMAQRCDQPTLGGRSR